MKIWIAGTVDQVLTAARTGLPGAIVTNPTVVAQWTTTAGTNIEEIARRIVGETPLPLYLQLRGPDRDGFLREAAHFAEISPQILPKLPSTTEGIAAAAQLQREGRTTLVTTVCSLVQAYLCAVAGVADICPYFARLDDSGTRAEAFLATVAAMYRGRGVATAIMPASVRSVAQAEAALRAGAAGVIVFDDVFRALCDHSVTASSLTGFETDWKQTRTIYSHNL